VKYFRALDPRRSLSTAVAWLAVAVSLTTALALLAVGTFAMNSMLVQRDALMQRYADQVAGDFERAYAEAVAAWPPALGVAPDISNLVPGRRLAAIVDAVRARVKPDTRARVLLLDARQHVMFEHPDGAAAGPVPAALQATPTLALEPERRMVTTIAPDETAPTLRSLGLRVAVTQPSEEHRHGGSLQEKLTAISILLGIGAALLGAAFARRLTRRLADLTTQVQRVARQTAEGIVEPSGRDEVAILGRAFAACCTPCVRSATSWTSSRASSRRACRRARAKSSGWPPTAATPRWPANGCGSRATCTTRWRIR
jgi:hypothetical protein